MGSLSTIKRAHWKTRWPGAILIAAALGLALSGCSSVIFQPTYVQYYDPARAGVSPENIWFASADGVALHGWYFRNRQNLPPKALVVFFHGNAQNLTSHFVTLLWLLDHQIDYLIFDYRGYGLSFGQPTPQGAIEDGKAALRWAQYRLWLDGTPKTPIVVFAQSLGGAIAQRAVAESKEEVPIRLVLLDSTFDSYKSEARSLLSRFWFTWPLQALVPLVLSDRYAPGDAVAEISPIPLIIMHGDRDPVVAFEFGQQLFEKAKEPKQFWLVRGGVHTDGFWRKDTPYRTKFLEEINRIAGRPIKKGD